MPVGITNMANDQDTQDTTDVQDLPAEVAEEAAVYSSAPVSVGVDVTDPSAFNVGDTIRVHYKIVEGEKTRIQPYEGIVISKRGSANSRTFTVRRIGANNIGVERIFPLLSPNIDRIDILKAGRVRRAKLFYLRDKKGRAATRVKEARKITQATE